MKMKYFFCLMLCTSVMFGAFAQQDQQAKALLDAVSKKYKTMNGMEGSFEYTYEHKQDDIQQTNTGKVAVKGEMYRLSLPQQEIWNDGQTSWTLIKSNNYQEVTISEVDHEIEELTPSNIFNIYRKGFDYKLLGEKQMDGKSLQQVELTAQDKKNQFQRIVLYVDKSNNVIRGWDMKDNTGGVLNYRFKNIKTEANLPDSYFVFHKSEFPGVEIIDLR